VTRYRLHEPDGTLRLASDVDFDAELKRLWDERDAAGVVVYGIAGLERKRVGRLGVQLNLGRQRKEEALARQLTDDNPVVAEFGAVGGTDFHAIHAERPRQRLMEVETGGRLLAVNVNHAPILPHHFLLVPEPDADAPQVATERALEAAQALLGLSRDPSLILGYNSLGAWASINHLHFQGVYYPSGRMYVMRAPRELVCATGRGRLERVVDFPLPCFAAVSDDPRELRRVALAVIGLLHARDVPYTLLATRTELFVVPKGRGRGELVPTGAGFFETGGEIFVGSRALYDAIGEADVAAELAAGAVEPRCFGELTAAARELLARGAPPG